MKRREIIVIGAGAAGLSAACAALDAGADVTVLEQNEKAGKKIYITGKGRCNYTNVCDTSEFFTQVVRNPKFLYSSVYGYDASAVTAFLEENGCPTKVERGQRAFPESDHASDVTKAFVSHIRSRGGRIRYNVKAAEILTEERDGECAVSGVLTRDGERIPAACVILATGGMSYPSTGADGAGYRFAEALGLSVVPARPALVPLVTEESWAWELQGLSLKNVRLTLVDPQGKKKHRELYSGFGEMLFTHFGVSGPLVLSASSYCDFGERPSYELHLDLKPALSREQLLERFQREAALAKDRTLGVFLRALLPERLARCAADLFSPGEERRVRSMQPKDWERLADLLKDLPLTAVGTRGFSEAIITAGGISVGEVSPSTMEAKKVKNLYICGELLDVSAMTGGFNLQIAWSTGHQAGAAAAAACGERRTSDE